MCGAVRGIPRAHVAITALAGCLLLSSCGTSSTSQGARGEAIVAALATWTSLEPTGMACPEPTGCVVIAERDRGERSQAIYLEPRGARWSAPMLRGPWTTTTNGAPESVACSTDATCISTTGELGTLSLFSPASGRWSVHRVSLPGSAHAQTLGPAACSPGGDCWTLVSSSSSTAGGRQLAYVVGEDGGHWLAPYPVGGPDLRVGGQHPSLVWSEDLSCWSRTSCTVAAFVGGASTAETLAQTEVDGRWGPASVAPTSVWSTDDASALPFRLSVVPAGPALACLPGGTCLLGGYEGNSGAVAQERDGRWQLPVTGLGHVAPYGGAQVTSVACDTASLCVAGGATYLGNGGSELPFAQARVDGHWRRPVVLRGLGRSAVILFENAAACPTASTCDFFGALSDGSSAWNPTFVASYAGSTWRYSLLAIAGAPRDLQADGLACGAGVCWIDGAFARARRDLSIGFVAHFPTFRSP